MTDAAPAGFSSSVESATTPADRPAAVLVCEGDLDLAAVAAFEGALDEAHDGAGLVVDLSAVRFIDSSGIHALVKARASAGDEGVEIVVAAGSAVERVLEMSGLLEQLRASPDRQAALGALDEPAAPDGRPAA